MPNNQEKVTSLTTSWSVANGTSYATIPLLVGISHKDQLEIERPFTTPTNVVLKQQDLRSIFVIPASNYVVNETTKKITSITAPATYKTSNNITVNIPAIGNGDILKIRRKSVSSEALVSWVDGTRLTASQLNLQSSQLLNLTQEILDRLRHEYVTATDIDYNATYNSATRSWVEDRLNVGVGTVKAYVDNADTILTNSVNALNTKIGINGTIIGSNNENVVAKLNDLEGRVGGVLFDGFTQHSIVIVGAGGTKNFSNNFTLTTGSPNVLTLTGNQNLTGKLTLQGVSSSDIVSIKNSSGTEVNTIDQHGNIKKAAASTSQTNPIIGSLHFDTVSNNLSVYGNSGWQAAATFNAPANQVTLDTVQEITHSKSFSANTGFGIPSNPLTIVDIKGTSGRTSFTGTSTLGTTIRGSTAATDYSGIDLTGGTTGTGPKARIAALFESGGSKLQLGTSNNYSNGITNTGLTIDNTGKVGILQTSPSFTLDVNGTGRFTGTVNLNDDTTINNNKNIRFLDSGNTPRNSFRLNTEDKYQIGDVDNTIAGNDFEIHAKENIEFVTNGFRRVKITNTGRLGIGTLSPNTVLHIVTDATANTITQGDGSGTLAIGLNGSSSGSISHTGSSANNKLTISSDREIVLDGSNTTIASGRELNTNTIKSIGTTLQLQNNTVGNNVGIGTNSPSSKLEVNGNISTTAGAGNKIISDTIETAVIQNTGTIEFRQGYNTNSAADMTIDSNGIVVFAQTPKVGNQTIMSPEDPVVCAAYGSTSNFRFTNEVLTHYHDSSDGTGYAVSYLKQGKVVYVYGVVGCNVLGNTGVFYIIGGHSSNPDSYSSTSRLGNSILRGLPKPAMKKWHFTGLAFCGLAGGGSGAETNNEYARVRRRIYGGYVDTDGFLRVVGDIAGGGDTNLNNLLPSTYSASGVATAHTNWWSPSQIGWLAGAGTAYSSNHNNPPSDVFDRSNWFSSYFQKTSNIDYHRLAFVKQVNSYETASQYIILNFSYIAL